MNAFIEERMREMPEQYLWTHRRFKTRPEAGRAITERSNATPTRAFCRCARKTSTSFVRSRARYLVPALPEHHHGRADRIHARSALSPATLFALRSRATRLVGQARARRQHDAFASYERGESAAEMKLDKLYVSYDLRGQGYGSLLLRHVEQRAPQMLGCRRVYLQVNKNNESAIEAYRRNGFEVAHAASFDIGNGYYMDDYVMANDIIGTSKRRGESKHGTCVSVSPVLAFDLAR